MGSSGTPTVNHFEANGTRHANRGSIVRPASRHRRRPAACQHEATRAVPAVRPAVVQFAWRRDALEPTMQPSHRIATIERLYPDQWVVVEVTRVNRADQAL